MVFNLLLHTQFYSKRVEVVGRKEVTRARNNSIKQNTDEQTPKNFLKVQVLSQNLSING